MGREPLFEDIGGFFWEVATSLAVESGVVDTNMLLESDVIVAMFVSRRRVGSVLLVGVVQWFSTVLVRISRLLHVRVLVITLSALIHHSRLRGLRV